MVVVNGGRPTRAGADGKFASEYAGFLLASIACERASMNEGGHRLFTNLPLTDLHVRDKYG